MFGAQGMAKGLGMEMGWRVSEKGAREVGHWSGTTAGHMSLVLTLVLVLFGIGGRSFCLRYLAGFVPGLNFRCDCPGSRDRRPL